MKPDKEWVEKAKRKAAVEAAKNVRDGFVIGLGSGSTAAYAIEEIGARIRSEEIRVLAVPTSYQAFTLAVKHKMPVTTLMEHPQLDLTIDGADQIDDKLNLVKGMGGALTREKVVASASKRLIIVADERKKAKFLGEDSHPVPVEVLPFAASVIADMIKKMRGKPVVRESTQKVGPVITDNGNFIIDADFGIIRDPSELNLKLKSIPGTVETGLFIEMVDTVYIGKHLTVEKIQKRKH